MTEASTSHSESVSAERMPRFRGRDYSTGLIGALAMILAIAVVSAAVLSPESSEPVILTILAILSFTGVFAIFAYAFGMLRFEHGATEHRDLTRIFADQHLDGLLITDVTGTIHYANGAYLRLVGGRRDEDIPTMEQVFSGNTAVSDQIFRLSRAAQCGEAWDEDVRLENFRTGGEYTEKTRWFRISTFPLGETLDEHDSDAQIVVWRITETTGDRTRHEDAFQKLQEAITYLDSAPTGFFSMSESGEITYLNATLAQWLGIDLADSASEDLKLENIMSGGGAALVNSLSEAGNVEETQELDIDLLKSDGTSLPVQLLHRIFIDSGGRRQSQTMILKR
ncbi:MAG: PAS domain-containing protein, partial [Desulfobulbia bacterium]